MTRMLFVGLMAALFTLPAAAQPPAKAQVSAAVRSLAFSDDGSRLAAGVMPPGRGGAVIVWDVATRKPVSKYEQAGESPNVAFTPDGKTLVFANGRSSLVLLDPATGAKTGESGPLPAQVTSLHRGPDGMWLALGTDNTVYLWDPAARKVVRSFAFGKQPWSWAASPKGGWLFVSGNGGDKLWNVKTGAEAADAFKPRPGSVSRAAFMGEDRMLVGTNVGSHRIIEVPSGKELLRFKNEGGPDVIAYSPAAGMMATRYNSDVRAALTPLPVRAPTDAEKGWVAALLQECDPGGYPTRANAATDLAELGDEAVLTLRRASPHGHERDAPNCHSQ